MFNRFVDKNINYWSSDSVVEKSKKGIYFESLTELFIPLMLAKFITAKGIQNSENCGLFELKFKSDSRHKQLEKAFGFRTCGINLLNCLSIFPKALFETIKYYRRKVWNNDSVSYVCNGVEIGDLIYDHIIRTTSKVTIDKKLNLKDLIIVVRAMLTYFLSEYQYKIIKPVYFVATDLIYSNAIPARLAAKYGATIVVATTGKKSYVYPQECIKRDFSMYTVDMEKYYVNSNGALQSDSDYKTYTDSYMKNIYSGMGDWNIANAYSNKKIVDRNEMLSWLGIRNDKKNIVILPHCFSDAPHCSSFSVYKDYYQWFEETLKIACNIKSVNWVIKEHPCHKEYNEEGIVKELYLKYKTDNMYYLPNDFSTAVVPKLADAILTVRGSAGMEMTCQGVRCILGGLAYYSGISSVVEVKSIEDYRKVLNNLQNVKKLSEEEIDESKRVLWKGLLFNEDVEDTIQQICFKYYLEYFKCQDKNSYCLNNFYKDYMKALDVTSKEKIYWYKWGNDISKQRRSKK